MRSVKLCPDGSSLDVLPNFTFVRRMRSLASRSSLKFLEKLRSPEMSLRSANFISDTALKVRDGGGLFSS